MPTDTFPSATPSFPAPTVAEVPICKPPNNLDALDAAQLKTDVETLLLDGCEAARLMLYGGGVRRRVYSVNGVDIIVGAPGAALVKSGGTRWKVMPKTTDFATYTPGGLAASTRYWLYVYDNAGTLTLEHSTTGPDVGVKYKSGDLSRMYISTFITDASMAIARYTQINNEYDYDDRYPPGLVDGNLILDAGNDTGTTTVPLDYSYPSQASRAMLQCRLTADAGAARRMNVYATTGSTECLTLTTAASTTLTSTIPFSTAIATNVLYDVSNAAASAYIWVAGFVL